MIKITPKHRVHMMRAKAMEGLQVKGGHVEAPFSLRAEQEEECLHATSWHVLHHGIAEETSILLTPCVHNFHSFE